MPLIYLAGPYSDPSPTIRNSRAHVHAQAAGFLMSEINTVFSPIAHGHAIAYASPKAANFTHEMWMKQCMNTLAVCDHIYVLPLSGWKESKGLEQELKVANLFEIPMVWLQGNEHLEAISDSWLTRNYPSAVTLPWRI